MILHRVAKAFLLSRLPVDARLSTLVAIEERTFMRRSVVFQTLSQSTLAVLARLAFSSALVFLIHFVGKKCLSRHA